MNLIELSNNLKDVPDQLLLKEVQEPTGAYPAYLVITEMTRRKRMRESAVKEAPETTVAEDLTQPSREQMMQAMAQMQQGQAQPMSQPPQSLNAGLMGAAQPDELAAMDANAAPQQAMAGGGLVAFGSGGEVPRFRTGGDLMTQQVMDEYGLYPVELTPSEQAAADESAINAKKRADVQRQLKQIKDQNIYGRPDAATQARINELEGQLKSAPAVVATTPLNATKLKASSNALDSYLSRMNVKPESSTKNPFADSGGGGGEGRRSKQSLNATPAAVPEEQKQLNELTKGILAFKDLNPEQQAAAQARGEAAYQEKTPFRLGFLEESMKERQGDIDKMKDTAFNNMLMQTGAGIMRSKSPYFLSALGEGSEAGLAAYQQGIKDLRASKDALLQSKVSFANAQTLYDQGKTAAGERERDRADKLNARGLELANSKFAAYAKIQENKREEEKLALEKRFAPFKEKYYGALANQANYRGSGAAGNKLSDVDQNKAQEAANMFAIMQGFKPGSPEFENARNLKYQEEILKRAAGANYQPGTSPLTGTSGVQFLGFK
jgi:hypothetical protein